MLLYPILCPAQYAELTSHSRLIGRWSHVEEHHVDAYRWMIAAMERRGIHTHSRPPVWAWHSHNPPHRRKPDLRGSYHLTTPGTPAYRLTIEAPDTLVLLSDYHDWHAVLNRWFHSHSESEANEIESLQAQGKLTSQMIETSWERIFDLGAGDPDWCGKPDERVIQACLPHIDLQWVREVTSFTARGKSPPRSPAPGYPSANPSAPA